MIYMPLKKHHENVDMRELELPETTFVRDIDDKVFEGIVVRCLSQIEGIGLTEGNFIDHILCGRESVKGITVNQDEKSQCASIKIELNISFGISIPEKAEEIQTLIATEVSKITGLHVSSVHVIFKNIVPKERTKPISEELLKRDDKE